MRIQNWTAALLLGGIAGCATPLQHRLQTDHVARKGPEAVKREIAAVFQRCQKPRVASAEAGDDRLDYTVGRASGPVLRLVFAEVKDVVVYDNHFVFVYLQAGGPRKLLFGSETDAIDFAELLLSLRQWSASRAMPAVPSAPPPGATPEIQPLPADPGAPAGGAAPSPGQ